MKKDSFVIENGELYFYKGGRKLIFNDSIRANINEQNKKKLYNTAFENGVKKNNTWVHGKVLHAAIEAFKEEFGDFTADETHDELEFDADSRDAKFIVLMSRKTGFVNFLLSWYYQKIKEEEIEDGQETKE
jgi:hypothetical protein